MCKQFKHSEISMSASQNYTIIVGISTSRTDVCMWRWLTTASANRSANKLTHLESKWGIIRQTYWLLLKHINAIWVAMRCRLWSIQTLTSFWYFLYSIISANQGQETLLYSTSLWMRFLCFPLGRIFGAHVSRRGIHFHTLLSDWCC